MTIDPIEFRNTLGNFATGVCIIGAEPQNGKPFGMTVNSFASVSLSPPLVLWSLQNNSECFEAFEKTEMFSVNILSQAQKDMSNRYAKKGDHELAEDDFHFGSAGTPVINQAISSFECKVWARYPGGDHVIIVGEVVSMETHADSSPLLFHCGGYKTLQES